MTEQEYKGKRVAFFTLGCKLNFSETSTMARKFEEMGFSRADFKDFADVYVINSCSVTAESDKKSRNQIRAAIKRNPQAIVMVTGCYAQLKSNEIAEIEGVDYVLGSAEKMNITSYVNGLIKPIKPVIQTTDHRKIKNYFSSYSFGDRTRTFLKVQDGCNYFCTYCTVPMARGTSRNDTIANTLREAQLVASRGIKEIILTGVNIGDFGRSTGETFFDLVKALDEVEGIERFRISSVEPNLLSNEIIEFVASSNRFAPHFHIPLQSGSNDVLALMKRKYPRELFAEKVRFIKSLMPDAFIGVDVIAGTNGETEELFQETLQFINGLDISQLHVFPYSERPNTAALQIPFKVPVHERHERVKQLIEISERKHRLFYENQLGALRKVLFEADKKHNRMFGWSDNYIRIETSWNPKLVNQVVPFKLESINTDGNVEGHLISSIYI
ncbi:MAG TPA: tRNA (N(6)-L-threonylcarbamoyladenosine(37)-C(2))-methylthiotransferase MtaB [Prolixibacteraceae bacterium]|nr:tRNA (N(6)-L-threonylcarbamoyladenosine(37)-C(2))-methylthiotransferase MtaB [Prolixibacteraceae bacterium]HPS12236.1 tRNA (N(6)-L-threonylcarbamoyladenosine(37)-C(2))-methylthiotransferase MtaB [Prolixibacteraceae bacterium]